MSTFLHQFETRERRIGLAVSGGADSMALLELMSALQDEYRFKAFVLHVDHGLRRESKEDARFVEERAAHLNLPFHAVRARIRRRRGESIEMAARRVRLAFFARMTRQLALDAIATGHHADDVAETFILRLARGSGADGLAGLKPVSHVNGITFIRPLLNLRDTDLRAFLTARGLTWREDATNADLSIPRNNVRHVILPFLRTHLDPRITEHLCKSAAILRGDLVRDTSPAPAAEPVRNVSDVPAAFTLSVEETTGFQKRPEAIGRLPAQCELSRAALAGRSLVLRPWEPGDRITPIGLNGHSRKIQDVFVTAKVPPALRAVLPLLVDADTREVLWVPGYRMSEAAAVESATAPSWRFTLSASEEAEEK